MPSSKTRTQRSRYASGRKTKGLPDASKHIKTTAKTHKQKVNAKVKAKRDAERLKRQMADVNRRAVLEATRRRPPARGKQLAATVPTGSIGHHYHGNEFVGKSHSAIHQRIKEKVLNDLSANSPVLNSGTTCAYGLGKIAAKTHDKDYIEHFTDDKGRTTLAIGRIAPDPTPDPKGAPPTPTSGIVTAYDDRGHLVPEKGVSANAVNTANTTKNIVAENWVINQHYKKAMEDTVKMYANANPKTVVHTMHQPVYNGDELRPERIIHFIVIDGKAVSAFTFENKKGVIERRAH